MAGVCGADRLFPKKYILESCGPFVLRFIELSNGQRIQLTTRKAASCTCQSWQGISVVPTHNDGGVGAYVLAKNRVSGLRPYVREPREVAAT
jgi:hypothetical protein